WRVGYRQAVVASAGVIFYDLNREVRRKIGQIAGERRQLLGQHAAGQSQLDTQLIAFVRGGRVAGQQARHTRRNLEDAVRIDRRLRAADREALARGIDPEWRDPVAVQRPDRRRRDPALQREHPTAPQLLRRYRQLGDFVLRRRAAWLR